MHTTMITLVKIHHDRPPRKSRPMISATITTIAPRSGWRMMRNTMAIMAKAIGRKPFWKECMKSCRRTVNHAAMMRAATFIISETCRFMTPSPIQRLAPLTDFPIPGTRTSTSSAMAAMKTQKA